MHLTLFKPDEHYMIISEWREERNLPQIALEGFPKIGLVVYEKEKPLLASFLYNTDSYWAFIDGAISDPKTTKKERTDAVDMVLKGLISLAEFQGKKIVATYITQKHLGKALKENNFKKIVDTELYMRGV